MNDGLAQAAQFQELVEEFLEHLVRQQLIQPGFLVHLVVIQLARDVAHQRRHRTTELHLGGVFQRSVLHILERHQLLELEAADVRHQCVDLALHLWPQRIRLQLGEGPGHVGVE